MKPREIKTGNYVRSIDRALYIIQFLNQENGVTANYMSMATQIPRPTTYRILETLRGLAFVRKDESGRYWLEPEIISLSAGYLEDKQLIDCFNDLLNDLSGEIPWPLSISTRKGNSMVIRASTDLDSSEAASRKLTAGWAMPGMLNSAAGIVYTAFCDEETRRQILNSIGQDPVSPSLFALDPEAMAQTLEEMQKKGFAFAEHNITWNWADRTSALAVPIFSEGFLFGALSLRFFRERTSDDEVLSKYLSKMRRTSTSIGLLLRNMGTD